MKKHVGNFFLLVVVVYLVIKSCFGFQNIAWGTGVWWGEYSLKWGIAYILYILVCVFIFIVSGILLWRREKFQPIFEKTILFRERLGIVRWFLALIVFIAPVWFFQYTAWGLVFSDIYIRILIWCLIVLVLSFFITKGNVLVNWTNILVAVLLTSSEFVIAVPFMNVTDYPFSLGWSEGNRMWDYSIMFGKDLYNYPADQKIVVLLDTGRQFVGGLPFIIPGLTIGMERFWIALTIIIPYLLLGLAVFHFVRKDLKIWLLATLCVLIFLKQGPIHPPLVLCAVAVAFLWRRPLWLALPLIAITGYIAEGSRFTWVFAPGMWIGMLELAGAALQNNALSRNSWIRAISLGLAGMAGGQFGQKIAGLLAGNATAISTVSAATSVNSVVSQVSSPSQPLLWYRLLPNETYGVGILIGLLIATAPLIIVLLYLIMSKKWVLNIWQALSIIGPLFAFLGVGIIVSTKIGGGGDLHNMDMFLIGLMFAGVIAWQKGGWDWLTNIELSPAWVKVVLVLLLALPGLQALGDMRSFSFMEDISWLRILTDAPDNNTLDMYPSDETANSALAAIREEVAIAKSLGEEVLFMDQRQLLTFGYIPSIPLIPEYEKKVLMNNALGSRANYFQGFYDELAEHRFTLIVSEILRTPIKDSSFQFGEENNAWVKWVANPILCYYEPKLTIKEVGVQLLVPKSKPVDCSSRLPLP
ncbi:MAG: hypothetical protein H7Y59_17685 [Anaerolineales bacterium]|nr:hypothetical protein [Anaerolineales bacterium]